MYEDLLFEKEENGVGTLTINKERSLNVLSGRTILELGKFTAEQMPAENLRVLVVTGAGGKAFAAGADVKQMREMTKQEFGEYCDAAYGVFDRLRGAPFPVIAAVNGYALGGGFELALACDFRMAASSAKVGFPEAGLGLFPCWGGTTAATMLAGASRAKEFIFTAEMMSAEEALRAGLLDRVVEPAELMDEVMKTAGRIAKNSPLAVRLAKSVISEIAGPALSLGLRHEMEKGLRCFDSKDRLEGMSAFLEKRTAEFTGE